MTADEPRRAAAAARLAPATGRSGGTRPRDPLARLLDRQHGILSRDQATALGVGMGAIKYRIQPGGPWQRIFPGVYLAGRGDPTVDQRDMAALLDAGDRSLLTGRAALGRYGILPRPAGIVDVLVPLASSRAGLGYLKIHRTRRMPGMIATQGPIRFTTIPRAVTDAALGAGTLPGMRAIVAAGVDRGRCTPEELLAELGRSRLPDSARLRSVIDDIGRGIRSAPEGDLMDLINQSGLPQPACNPRPYLGRVFLAKPDAWRAAAGVAVEVDSREHHYREADWQSTMQRHTRMTAAGIRVLHFTPWRIRTEPDQVIATIRQTLRTGSPVTGLRTELSDS